MIENTTQKNWIRMYQVASQYLILQKVGRGTYGTVYKAKNLKNGKHYAIKKLENNDAKLQAQGFPITALRQISLLKQMDHENIIKLKQIILSKPSKRNLFRGSTFLVFEYMDHDLAGLFKNKTKFILPQVKCIIRQLLKGVSYLHANKIMHRDIKSANILINDDGQVKLADFGLGRICKLQCALTCKVVTLWYRAPQLLLGCNSYDFKVDVWSIGCVLAQFLIGQVLFKKQSDYAQIERIYQICGGLQENNISEQQIKKYSYYNDMKPKKAYKPSLEEYIKKLAPNIDNDTMEFLCGLLSLNPAKRFSCQQALKHPFFEKKPYPCKPNQIQKMQYQCHQMFRDRVIVIHRSPQYDKQRRNFETNHTHQYNSKQIIIQDNKDDSEISSNHSKNNNKKQLNYHYKKKYIDNKQNNNKYYQKQQLRDKYYDYKKKDQQYKDRKKDNKYDDNKRNYQKSYDSERKRDYREYPERKEYREYKNRQSVYSKSPKKSRKHHYYDEPRKNKYYHSPLSSESSRSRSRKKNDRDSKISVRWKKQRFD